MKNKRKGFTLVELLVVIAILAILATVSVVGYISFINRANESNAQTEAHQIEQAIKHALILDDKVYIKKADDYYIVCTREGNDYVVSKSTTEPIGATKITDIPENLIQGIDYLDVGGLTYTSEKGVVVVIKIPTYNESQGLEFALNSDNASYYVKSIGSCTDTDIVIPSTYEGLPVTKIGAKAFYSNNSITSVIIPDSVTIIDNRAFKLCTSLTSMDIPDSVTSIGGEAFYDCTALMNLTIGESVTSIDFAAFYNCQLLTRIVIPGSVTSIASSAFSRCNSITSIGPVGSGASVEIPDSLDSIASSAFAYCDSLTSVTIPDTITSIEGNAFYACQSLTSVTIGKSVASIAKGAFESCNLLTSIDIPISVTSIEESAFKGCWIKNINVDEDNEYYKSLDGSLYSKDGKTLMQYAMGQKNASFVIPDTVTRIASHAFYNSSGLATIEIPSSVTSIGDFAFQSNILLTNISFKGTVEQWEAISKGNHWNSHTGNYTIHCTNGEISKDGTVTYK